MTDRVGCYPGSFDPITVAHVAVARAAIEQCHLTRLDFVLSRVALGKAVHHAPVEARAASIAAVIGNDPQLGVVVTDRQLLADIAEGYDVVVVGADKWAQVLDVAFYESALDRDAAVARLPEVACAPRAGHRTPQGVTLLDVPSWAAEVSSTAVRDGADHWRARSAPTRQSPE